MHIVSRRFNARRLLMRMAIGVGLLLPGCAYVPGAVGHPPVTRKLGTWTIDGAVLSYERPSTPNIAEPVATAVSGFDFSKRQEHCRIKVQTAEGTERVFIHMTGCLADWGGNVFENYGNNEHPPLKKGDLVEITYFPEKENESGTICTLIRVLSPAQ